MFGHNEIVGQKAFPDEDRLLVTSFFATLQGEGPFSGRRAVFLRLSKCNLACSFCDTYFDQGNWFDFDRLRGSLDALMGDHVRAHPLAGSAQEHDYKTAKMGNESTWGLVVTGGEPMLQKALKPFLDAEVDWWGWVQIESNGIIHQDIHEDVTLVVSPKCLEKAHGEAARYLKPHPKNLERANCLKFVMEDADTPYASVPDWALEWRDMTQREIYVSPMNVYNRKPQQAKIARNANQADIHVRSAVEEKIAFWEPGLLDLERNEANHKHAADYAIRHGLRFQVQAHLYAGVA